MIYKIPIYVDIAAKGYANSKFFWRFPTHPQHHGLAECVMCGDCPSELGPYTMQDKCWMMKIGTDAETIIAASKASITPASSDKFRL
jgi:hypothetical protein